ncbi:hypothetical protein Tco_0124395, partial [Tanacetum coccineum]
TTNHSDALPPSSSPVNTSDNLEEFADELTLKSNENPLFNEMDEDVENKNSNISNSDEPVLLNSPLIDKDSGPVQEEIDIFLVSDDLIPPGVENDDFEDEDNSTFLLENELSILESSAPRPPPEPPDVCLNFKPDTAMNNDFNQGEIVLPLNVEDVNSFTFVI